MSVYLVIQDVKSEGYVTMTPRFFSSYRLRAL